jgi:hypothetical protein
MIDSIHRALIFVFATRLVLGLFKSRADASADPCFSFGFWFRSSALTLILVARTLRL